MESQLGVDYPVRPVYIALGLAWSRATRIGYVMDIQVLVIDQVH